MSFIFYISFRLQTTILFFIELSCIAKTAAETESASTMQL